MDETRRGRRLTCRADVASILASPFTHSVFFCLSLHPPCDDPTLALGDNDYC